MKASIEGDTPTAAPLQAGTSASFVLGLGTDGPSPSRKAAGRVRHSAIPSKIPQRPSGSSGSAAVHAVSDGNHILRTSGSNPTSANSNQPSVTAMHLAPGRPQSIGSVTSGPATSGSANTDGTFPMARNAGEPGAAPGPSQPALPLPTFAVGASDGQSAGVRTPRGPRIRATKHKASAVSPLITPTPVAERSTPLPFSPFNLESLETMTPIDDNTYQKLAPNSRTWGILDGESPMDITPQGSTLSATSNVFLFSPLVGVSFGGQKAGGNDAGGGSAANGGGQDSSADSLPVQFPGFSAAMPGADRHATGLGAAPSGSVPNGAEGPSANTSASATGSNGTSRPACTAGCVTGSSLKFPIQIQIPGAREVQDMFTSASSLSTSGAPPAGNSSRGVTRPSGPSDLRGQQQGPQNARMAAAVAAAAAKKLPDAGAGASVSGDAAAKSGMMGPTNGGAAGNDCQPPKDNAAKVSRITVDNATAVTAPAGGDRGTAAATAFPSTCTEVRSSVAAAPSQTPASTSTSVAVAAAALGLAAASAATVVSGPSDAATSPVDVLIAVAEQLEHMARKTREAAATAVGARDKSQGINTTAVIEAVIANLSSESNPAIRSVLEIMLQPGAVDAKVAAVNAAATASAPQTVPGLTAAVACMLGALKLDVARTGGSQEAVGVTGSTLKTAAPFQGDGSRNSSTGGIPSVPFVFGCAGSSGGSGTACSSQGGGGAAPAPAAASVPPSFGFAAATASTAPAPGSAALPSQGVATSQGAQQKLAAVPFLFGCSKSSCPNGAQPSVAGTATLPSAGSAPANFGSAAPSAFGSASGATAAATAAFGGASADQFAAPSVQATSQQPPPTPFVFGVPGFSSQNSAQPTVREASVGDARCSQQTELSASMASAHSSGSFMSGAASPMSTTPMPSGQQTANLQPMASASATGWTGSASAATTVTNPVVRGFIFTVGGAGAAMANDSVTPGRIGGRARAKITPRKPRGPTPMDTGNNTQPITGFSGSAPAASATAAPVPPAVAMNGAPAMGPPSQPATVAEGPSKRPAEAAAQSTAAGQHANRSHSSSAAGDVSLDAAALEAMRLKREADEKKQYGNQKYEMSDFRSAERWYSEAIEVFESRISHLGISREKLQQLFPNLKTETAVLYSNRSGARLMTAKPHSALADALRAMELDPRFMRGVSRAATCHCRLGDFAAAHRIINAAVDRCSASSLHYQEMLKKLNEVVDLGSRARAATAAAIAASLNGTREKLQEAADQLAAIRDQVGYCDVVAVARAVLALRLGFPREVLALVAPHPEVPLRDRAAPWRLWLSLQAHFFKGDLQEALNTCKELHQSIEASGPEAEGDDDGSTGSAGQEQDGNAAAAAYTTSAHVTIPQSPILGELAETLQQMLKLKEDGNHASKQNRLTEAAECYTRALGLGCCPAFAAVLHANRAFVHAKQGATADAVADCGRARALDPTYYKASFRLASYMMELRRPDDAQGLLEPLIKLSSQSSGSGPRPEDLNTIKELLSEARSAASWQKTPQHYKLLGLANTCSEDDVKKAYRRLALKHHPDKALAAVKVSMVLPGRAGIAPYSRPMVGTNELEARVREEAAWLFNFINQAHEELSDKTRRRKVDQLLDAEQPPPAGRYTAGASSGVYGSSWYGNGNARYSGFSSFYGADPFYFHRPGGATGPAGGGSGSGGAGGNSRGRSATGGGAGAGGNGYGGYGGYGAYAAGSRPGSARQASGTSGANSNGPQKANNSSGNNNNSSSGNNNSSAGSNNNPGATRGSSGAAAGGATAGGGFSAYGRTGNGGAGPGARPTSGSRKWWEGGNDFDEDDDEDTFNF